MPRIVLHHAALADGTSSSLRTGVSLAIDDGKIAWIRPNDSADTTGAEVIDAGGLLVAAGLEPYEALASATRHGGALYGVDHAGRIDDGMPADLVLVHGDPLADACALWRVWAVFQRGVRVA